MDIHEAAAALDGCEYGEEGSREFFAAMREAGLVAVFGASDDLMEFRGAEYDETGPGTVYFTPDGLLRDGCDNDRCSPGGKPRHLPATVTSIWCTDEDDASGYSWRYRTDIPHAKFTVKEGDYLYCEGIVFALRDAVARPST